MHLTIHNTLSRLEAKIDGLYSLDLLYLRFLLRGYILNADLMLLSSAKVRLSLEKSSLGIRKTPISSAFLKPLHVTTS